MTPKQELQLIQTGKSAGGKYYGRVLTGIVDLRTGKLVSMNAPRELTIDNSRFDPIRQGISNVQSGIDLLRNRQASDALAGYAQNFSPGTATPSANTNQSTDTVKIAEDYIKSQYAKGLVLNPNVQITPDKLAEFTAQASREIDPYYASQLKLAKDTLLKSLGYSTQSLLRQEQDAEKKYEVDLRQLGETAADKGFAQSGLRVRDENKLAFDTQRGIEDKRRELSYNAGNLVGKYAQDYGSSGLTGLQNISETPRVIPGESSFQRSGRDLPVYELSPSVYDGLVGEQEFLRRGNIRTRASEIEKGYRQNQSTGGRDLTSLY